MDIKQVPRVLTAIFSTQHVDPSLEQTFSQWKQVLALPNPSIPLADTIVNSLLNMLHDNKQPTMHGLSARTSYSIPTLDMLTTYYGTQAKMENFLKLLQILHDSTSTGLRTLFDDALEITCNKFGIANKERIEKSASPEFSIPTDRPTSYHLMSSLHSSTSISRDVTTQKLSALLIFLGSNCVEVLEEFLATFVDKFLHTGDSQMGKILASALLYAMTSLPPCKAGPIMDYIPILLPDIEVDSILKLTFSNMRTGTETENTAKISYLMSALLHNSTWSELQNFISWILKKESTLPVRNLKQRRNYLTLLRLVGY